VHASPIFRCFKYFKNMIGFFFETCYSWHIGQFLESLYARPKDCENRLLASSYRSVRLSVRQHGTTGLPLDGFLWNLIFEDFSKPYRENSRFIKTGQE
jgi:hypothetical protein